MVNAWNEVTAEHRGRVVETLSHEAARWERMAGERPQHAERYMAEAAAHRAAIRMLEGKHDRTE